MQIMTWFCESPHTWNLFNKQHLRLGIPEECKPEQHFINKSNSLLNQIIYPRISFSPMPKYQNDAIELLRRRFITRSSILRATPQRQNLHFAATHRQNGVLRDATI